MARPRKKLDHDQIERLAAINNTVEDIAYVMGVDRRTINRRFAPNIEKGRAMGRTSLKKRMWDIAMNDSSKGSIIMCIFLSKQMLGYRDRFPDEVPNVGIPVVIEKRDGVTQVVITNKEEIEPS